MSNSYDYLEFHQFDSNGDSDRLLMFAPRAKDLAAWAGIPRKGWRIRMLFQRWITEGREKELRFFWDQASTPNSNGEYIISPTAIVIAIHGEPTIKDGKLVLDYTSPIENITDTNKIIQILSKKVFDQVRNRLSDQALDILRTFKKNPLRELPYIGHDYVLEFALQMCQMQEDPAWFISNNAIEQEELRDLITSMEALVRPALVVDGQHRLHGAQAINPDVYIPTIALTKTKWTHQIYQFVVINEKAQKVPAELLNDIFASSLTPEEQNKMRKRFSDVRVDIEQRIAGVLAGRDENSPFYGMVALNLPNPPESEKDAYIPQTVIQNLIEGGRGTKGWRSDDDFYRQCIQPNFPDRKSWDDWRDGKWQEYWFVFWGEVRDVYRKEAKRIKTSEYNIWDPKQQTNLTKGVGLKIFQRFYMEIRTEMVRKAEDSRSVLVDILGEDKADEAIGKKIREAAIPKDLDVFQDQVREFLKKFPVRFFTQNWETSLDDSSGQDKILYQMREAYTRDNWRASGGGVFLAGG